MAGCFIWSFVWLMVGVEFEVENVVFLCGWNTWRFGNSCLSPACVCCWSGERGARLHGPAAERELVIVIEAAEEGPFLPGADGPGDQAGEARPAWRGLLPQTRAQGCPPRAAERSLIGTKTHQQSELLGAEWEAGRILRRAGVRCMR